MSAPLVSVIVAVDQTGGHIAEVVGALSSALRGAGYQCEFVFVLDGPQPAIEAELRGLASDSTIKTVRLQGGGLGESIALSAGVARAAGDYILNVPPYLQTEPADAAKVVATLEAGADCVATWRQGRVDPWLNRLQSRFFNWALRLVMGMPFHDLNSGTRGFRRQVLEEVSVYGELYRFLPVLARRQGFRVAEVRVRHREERGRSGFYGIGVYLRRALDILAISFLTRFTQRPLRFFGYIGFVVVLLGVVMCMPPLYQKIFAGQSMADRPLFVIGAIFAAFGVQLIGFGLIGEIIIFTQSPNLRDYKVEEIIDGGAEHLENATRGATPVGAGAVPADPDPAPAAPVPATPIDRASGMAPAVIPAVMSGGGEKDVDGAVTPAPGSEHALRVRELLPGEDSRWDAFVGRHPQGTFFHLTGWSRVVRDVFHHVPCHLVVEQGRRWLGVLPMFVTRSPFLGRNLISLPYAVYGGILADAPEAQAALLQRAAEIARSERAGYVELRHLEARPGQRPFSNLYVTYRKDLPDDREAVMPSIPKKARAEVRRALKLGITLLDDCDVGTLFELFAQNKRRLGSPTLSRRWFEALHEEFGKAVVIHRAVEPSGRTLSACMSFCFKDTFNAYYSGSLTGVNDTGVMNFLYCAMMEWAVDAGFSRFDFGRSRVDSGPGHFKENMGFTAEPLHYEYLLIGPKARIPEFHPGNPSLALPRRIWSKLPMAVTNRLGSRLSRYLP